MVIKMQIHTSLEAGFTDLTATSQNAEPLQNGNDLVSAVVEVLEEEISSDCWNPEHFGKTPRKFDANGNPTIFWDESVEPPEPDDFESLQEYEEAWHKWEENSDNSICVAESGQAFLSQELSPEKLNYADSAKLTNFVKKDCAIASQVFQSTTMSENSQKSQESTSLPRHHLANPLPSKESAWVEQIHETVSPQYCESLTELNPNSSVSKTSPDYCRHPNVQEKNPEHISNRCSGSFASVGTMRSGWLSERDFSLEPDGLGKDFCSLPRPGALSCSGNGRPPGNTKSEAKAKKLGLIDKNEVYNPEWLEQEFGLPIGWTDPQAATQLLALVEPPSETALTPGLPPLHGKEYSTSTDSASVREQSGEYSTTTPNIKAISLWQPWASFIPLGFKSYETRSWKTNYRGKLLICSTAKSTKAQYQQYLKICNELNLPDWNETNFPCGCAIAICDLVDCIEMTSEFIAQQSQAETLCGDWQVGRYAWKLENIQPITEPFAVKGKQGLFNISLDTLQSQRQLVELLGDKEENSPSKDISLESDRPSNLLENERDNSSSKIISPSKNSPSNLLGDKKGSSPSNLLGDERDNSPSKITSPSNSLSNLLEDERDNSPSKKRSRGEGNGCIYWRTITKNGKEYPQAYYHWKEGNKKRSKYIPKKLLGLIEEADSAKRPVIEILKLLGVWTDSSKLLGDEEKARRNNDVNALVENRPDQLLGDKWIKNGEINISQGIEYSPSNLDNSPSKIDLSPSKRRKGDGSGNIHWRTITRGGKDYPQAYYHYEIWSGGDRLVKSSKYIQKRLLSQIQRLEAEKAPVKKILKVLGVMKSKNHLKTK